MKKYNLKEEAGSSLLSAGCHTLDALLFFIGNEVGAIESNATTSAHTNFAKYTYQTTSVNIMRFRNSSIGKVASVIDCLQPHDFHIHLAGSEGTLFDNKFYSPKLEGLNKNKWSKLSMKMLESGNVSDHPYKCQFEAFFDALDQGKEMPLTSLADAMYSHKVLFAADKAAGIYLT